MTEDSLSKTIEMASEAQSNPDYNMVFYWDKELEAGYTEEQVRVMDMAISAACAWHDVIEPLTDSDKELVAALKQEAKDRNVPWPETDDNLEPIRPTSSVNNIVEQIITDTFVGPGASRDEAQIIISYWEKIGLVERVEDDITINGNAIDEVGDRLSLWDAHFKSAAITEEISGQQLSHEEYNLLQVPDQFRLPEFRGGNDQKLQVEGIKPPRADS